MGVCVCVCVRVCVCVCVRSKIYLYGPYCVILWRVVKFFIWEIKIHYVNSYERIKHCQT